MGKSEEMQPIRRMHEPSVKTEFGNRVMTEIGVIKGLEVDDTVNYILTPFRAKNKSTSWSIHRLTKDSEAEVESWNDLDKIQEPVGNTNISDKP